MLATVFVSVTSFLVWNRVYKKARYSPALKRYLRGWKWVLRHLPCSETYCRSALFGDVLLEPIDFNSFYYKDEFSTEDDAEPQTWVKLTRAIRQTHYVLLCNHLRKQI